MEIEHYDLNDQEYINANELAPQWPFRLLICGSSGCGKTNLLLNLILKYLHFDQLYVFARDIEEPAYKRLQEIFESKAMVEEFENTVFHQIRVKLLMWMI